MLENGVLFQFFHWYSSNDGAHWRRLVECAPELARVGVTAVWLPPAQKSAAGIDDTGYGCYDLYDLGEFDQKGTVRTKYGTRAELGEAIRAAHAAGLQVYADVVLNHRQGADETEAVTAVEVDRGDRNRRTSEPYQIRAWTRFTFPGRKGRYSDFEWNATCFTSTDCNADAPGDSKIFLLNGKTFSGEVSSEFGNFDYLLGCDVDVYNPAVRDELFAWGRWLVDVTGVDGFRLDAVKHIPASFYRDFFHHIRTHFGNRELLGIGEYWSGDLGALEAYLAQTEGVMKLFDVPLHFRFMQAAQTGREFDLRTIFDGTLTKTNPLAAVTFVDSHDTQPNQSLASWVDDWFKPLAYALILLRREGYPCIFFADYYGAELGDGSLTSHRFLIDIFLDARRRYQHGDQHDTFDDPESIAWVRTGDAEHPGSLAVVMSTGDAKTKRLQAYAPGGRFKDLTGHLGQEITADGEGWGEFPCPAGSLSVWAQC
jgi:alpha-amylase